MEPKTIKTTDVKHVLILGHTHGSREGLIRGLLKYSRLDSTNWVLSINAPQYQAPDFDLISHKTIRDWGIHGIVDALQDPDKTSKLLSMGLPTIVFPDLTQTINCKHSFLLDDQKIAELTSEYFAVKQYNDLAYCGIDTWPSEKERRGIFAEVFADAGFRFHMYNQPHIKGKYSYDKEAPYLVSWLNDLPKPVAIVAGSLVRGKHILDACALAHINVPEDVSVVGIGDAGVICEMTHPPLSNVSMNMQSAGYQAGAILDRLMKGEKLKPQKILIPPASIFERRSSNMLAVNDDMVKEAIRFIRRNTAKLLSVSEVSEAVGVTNRTLDRRFEKTLGYPVHREIIHIRMEQICRLLVETDLPIAQIALDIGYSDTSNLNRDFKREKTMSLSTYRKKYSLI